MSIIIPSNSIVSGGFSVDNSCRFDDGSSDTMSRDNGTPTNLKKFSISLWFKRTEPGLNKYLITGFDTEDNRALLQFSSDQLLFQNATGGTNNTVIKSNAVFRDPSAWYHFCIIVDTTQSTSTNRVKMYVNGSQVTSLASSTYPDQNTDLELTDAANSILLNQKGDGSDFNSGYYSEVVVLDGTAASITDFGEFDEDSGIWKPIDVSGLTFGNNGFYLDFKDSANLGNDANGGTDFTESNLTATDQSTDTCTNNWCVQNSIATPISGSPTFSQGNLTIASGSGWKSTIGTFALTKGKWYWETKGGGSAGTILNGIASTAVIEAGGASNGVNNNATIGVNLPAYAYHGSSGAMYRSDTTGNGLDQGGGSWGTAYNTGDLISVYLDLDNYKLYTAKNNTLNVSGTGYSIASGYAYYPLCVPYTNTINLNYGIGAFGATAVSSAVADANGYGAFEYDPSRGGSSDFDSAAKDFLAICTKNLAEYG